jgi:hypothetical protein
MPAMWPFVIAMAVFAGLVICAVADFIRDIFTS